MLPAYVKEAVQKLYEAGHVAYLVGGCVRDFLLGIELKDYDIVTSAKPNELCLIFPNAVTVGKAFGVIKVPTGTHPPLLEIATFRQDLEYEDYRHPKGVVFSGPGEDAQRRDFTVNALMFDPKSQLIFDFSTGLDDLKSKVIRAIGNPSERFQEDALRLMRAIRFQTRLGFELDPATAHAVQIHAKLITRVSSERVRDELTGMWTGPDPARALQLLSEMKLLSHILPELEALKAIPQSQTDRRKESLWKHLLKTIEYLAKQNRVRSMALAWATVLHEVGRPVALKNNHDKGFGGHELESVKLIQNITIRLKLARVDADRIQNLVADHLKFRDVFQMREATLLRFVQQEHFEELLALHKADAMAWDGNLAYYEFSASRWNEYRNSALAHSYKLIDGNDLILLGLSPSPEFSKILRTIEDLALEKKISSKEEALEYVVKNFVK